MKIVLQGMPGANGPARHKYLTPRAAEEMNRALAELPGAEVRELWRDPVSELITCRLQSGSVPLGYSGYSFGISATLDTGLQVPYKDGVKILKKYNWRCRARDGLTDKPEAYQFNFFGEYAEKYLVKANFERGTWNYPIDYYIHDTYGAEFQLDIVMVQKRLKQAGFYFGDFTSELDIYTREAIMAFQRAWVLPENGQADHRLCRVLALLTAEVIFTR